MVSLRSPVFAALLLVVASASPLFHITVPDGSQQGHYRLVDVDEEAFATLAVIYDQAVRGGIVDIEINSPGGDPYVALRLIGLSEEAHERGVTTICTVHGLAASAAAFFFVAGCDRRLMGANASLLFHPASMRKSPLLGPLTNEDLRDIYNLNQLITWHMSRFSHLSPWEYSQHVNLGDWIVRVDEALANGMADFQLQARPTQVNLPPTP